VDKSLVRSNGSGRYDLHELVRQYAAEQLAASGQMEMIRHGHFTTYLALARTADSELRGADAIAWFTRLEVEQGNLREALGWAWGNRRYDDVAWLSVALGNFWMRQIRWREALGWLEPLLVRVEALPVDLQLVMLTDRLSYCLIGGQYRELDRHAAELKELIGRYEQKALQANALFVLGMSASDPAQSASLYVDAIRLVREYGQSERLTADWCMYSDTDFLLANLLFRYGNILRSHGDYAQAKALYQESLALLRAKGECDVIAYPLGNLGRLALIEGDLSQARRLLGEATAVAHAMGSTMSLAEWPPYLALVELYQGHTDEAWRLLQESLAFCKDIKNSPPAKKTMAIAALIRLQQRVLDDAEQFLRESLAGHRYDRWVKPELVDCLFTAMRLAAARQQFKRAAEIFGLAERLQAQIHHGLDQPVRPLVEAALEQVRNALGSVGFAAARKHGQALSLDDSFAQLLELHGLTNNVTSV
jgi:tetratricopeptide (TPR) repeat protein